MPYIFSDLVQRSVLRLSQVGGTAVQRYSEDILAEMMQHKFTMIFDKRFWEDYSDWYTVALTSTGVVEEDLTDSAGADIDRYVDIQGIYYNVDTDPLPRIQQRVNIAAFKNDSGRPYYHTTTNETGKLFRVLPYGSEQDVNIYARKRPEPFMADDEVFMDDQVLILGTVYDFLEDDGSNPRAAQKFLQMFNERYDSLIENINEQGIPLTSSYSTAGDPWGAQYT